MGTAPTGMVGTLRRRLAHDNGTLGNAWYVPGFGKQGSSKLAGTFNVTIEF